MIEERGQTTLDFAVGVSVFLGVVAFAFAFAPTMFAPFEESSGTEFVMADRAADRLTADALTDSPSEPSVLNESCTVGFFDADGSVPAGCRYDDDASDLPGTLGLDDATSVNVTLRRGGSVRTLGGVSLTAGETPTSADDAAVATRVVLLTGEHHRLSVRVW